jgi:hypothetical protein
MVLHVVLFQPRPDLAVADRVAIVEALENALRQIPSIRGFQLGRRVRHGAAYERPTAVDLAFAAILEFENLAGLEEYLHHPAHQALGRHFMQSLASSAIYDYEVVNAGELRDLARDLKVAPGPK